jgi:hypothetical protein
MMFPLFRKYSHNRTFFKILSESEFEEINLIGNYYTELHFCADIYPDKLMIQDMINNPMFWKQSTEEEFEAIKALFKKLEKRTES